MMGSQPTGGEPGGEMRKFFSMAGGRRWYGEKSVAELDDGDDGDMIGVGSARNTRRVVSGLQV